jgi:DEAD/DEAH box helicase domain-containing protein
LLMSLSALLSHWRSDPSIAANIVEWRILPARPAHTTPFPEQLHPGILKSLQEQGIQSLYIHQAAAWEHVQAGRNCVIVTGTASGKTLCYNLPIVDRLLRDPEARALFLFPTKALAQDQLTSLDDLLTAWKSGEYANPEIAPSVYDGDTSSDARPLIRKTARLLITNPDMLHAGILPHHTAWASFFQNLQFVVIDEMHIYRGVFGSHIANVIRRLKRITRHYGTSPLFILTSATISNPLQLASWLIEEPASFVTEDGSALGEKNFLIYNPPIVDRDLGLRRSLLQESVRLAGDLLTYQVQTILFGRARRTVEIMLAYLRERYDENEGNKNHGPGFPPSDSTIAYPSETIRGYRSGYLPRQRRQIEKGLRQGNVRAVVATNALELGIDIGGMGASLIAGYPGSITATWQQAGRAGRGTDSSLAILIASASPLDQFLAKHPDYFFGRTPEQALINPDNLLILLGHLGCAAFELPFQKGEGFGRVDAERISEFLEFLEQEGSLYRSGQKYFWMADRYPAEGVSLRSTTSQAVALQVQQGSNWTTIGQVDLPSANGLVHPGAVYLHEAQVFMVEELDLDQKIARLVPSQADYYTEPRSEVNVALLEKQAEESVAGGSKFTGEVSVTSQVMGYRKIKWYTHETLGTGEVSLPLTELQTVAYWLALSEQTVKNLREQGLWTNAPNDYGPDWSRLRDQVRARDGYRCQVCGAPELGRSHDVHHKVPFRSFDSLQQANQLSNLITLCPACHHQVETAVRIRSGLSGLAFVLANLVPLFLMCDRRDLGVHSDPESSLAEGQPAVIIYEQVPAGIGFSQRLFEIHDELMQRAYELVYRCECADGCPSCVGPGGENGSGGKLETLALLSELIQKEKTSIE